MKLIDFHVHLDYYDDPLKILKMYEEKEVYTLFVTNLPELYKEYLFRVRSFKYVRLGLGFNPQLIHKYTFNKSLFSKYINTTKYIGEVGLDFSNQFKEYRNLQIEYFNYVCQLSSQDHKILSIHSRKAESKVVDILEENNIKFAIFHWYTGNLNTLDKIINNEYYFSVNYSMLKSKKGREILKRIPVDKILIETDGPFSKINNKVILPNNLSYVYKKFEEFYKIENFDVLIYNNLKQLLNKQLSFSSKGKTIDKNKQILE